MTFQTAGQCVAKEGMARAVQKQRLGAVQAVQGNRKAVQTVQGQCKERADFSRPFTLSLLYGRLVRVFHTDETRHKHNATKVPAKRQTDAAGVRICSQGAFRKSAAKVRSQETKCSQASGN